MFNLQQLKILVLLAEYKRLTLVAKKLKIKQPSVTFHMKKLEQSTGVRLFIHKHKLVLFTDEGKALLHYATRIVSLSEEAEQVLTDYLQFKKGKIIIGSSNTPATYFLPKLLGEMRQAYPHVNIAIQVHNSPQIIDLVKKLEIDFGLVAEHQVSDPELVAIPMVNDELGLVMYPDHPLALADTIESELLQNELWILREQDSASRRMMELWADRNNISCKDGLELGTTEAIKRAIQCRLGISILSRLAVEDEVRGGQLIFKSLNSETMSRSLFFIYSRNRFVTPILQEWIHFFKTMRF
ncbi:LysR family transcriptional regulator [Paenibacillus sp. 5J-6]|uniref:LysR family transcriptional regulator n=1 Tax=Paenibacillus silvestris TaxID=2606219 RepID=A0A6L8UVJ4_9BACL|nr:LysR substrate-binding domain-containing protein [Paenibacillus silvestris]MZQ81130.1 LysR family transcriptional regulator [Paenibacillus silvestris]